MNIQKVSQTMTVISLLVLASCSAKSLRPVSAQELSQQPELMKEMRIKGRQASVTVFPIYMEHQDKALKDVGDALGLLLEQKAGLENIHTTEVSFGLPQGTDFDKAPALFGEFVRAHPLETDYALYAEFLGSPRTGATEIRMVVVDKEGHKVWVDQQTPDDKDFKRIKPDCPMTCCYLVSERLRVQLDLPHSPEGESENGRMAKMWAKKSGLPTDDERKAMEQRLQVLQSAGFESTFTIYPVKVGEEVEAERAGQLTKLFSDGQLCKAQTSTEQPKFEIAPNRNEQRRLWDLARAFRDYVRQNPPETDYAFYADYLGDFENHRVGAVHFVVCDRQGQWVIVDFQNSHHHDFKSINPESRQDCNRLVVKRLKTYLR